MRHSFRRTTRNKYLWVVLRRWRWQFLGLAVLTVLTVMLANLDDLVPFNLDLILLALYGVMIPFCTLWVVSALGASLAERARVEDALVQHQSFIRELEHCQDYGELTHFVIRYVARLLPVNHVSLFTYDHRNARLQLAAEWNSDNRQNSPVNRRLASSTICQACLITKSAQLRHSGACVAMLGLPGDGQAAEYCQPLIYDNLIVGVLRFRSKPGPAFAQDRIDFLKLIAPEIALALALSLAQPQQLTQVQLEAQIKERRSLAYDLHNSLAQEASYLQLTLERMLHDRNVVMADDVRLDLLEMRKVALDMYDEIRNDLAQLRLPPTPDLNAAITTYARSAASHANLKIQVASCGEPIDLPPLINHQIVSLLREGLTNIERHALARAVLITIAWSSESLIITVADDGVGFDPREVHEGHYGLALMRERSAELGGELDIDSCHDHGTHLTFRFEIALLRSWTLIWPARFIKQYEET